MRYKKILCVDFDGVIHSYVSGWKGVGVVADDPVPGAIAWLIDMVYQGYDLQVYSARSKDPAGTQAMRQWLIHHMDGVLERCYPRYTWRRELIVNSQSFVDTYIKFPTEKPSAWLTIDDRAICFRGTFPSVTEIENFKPWNK